MSGETTDVETMLEEKNQLISRQYSEIERLQRELAEIIAERDGLLCEVSKFKFELEMADLKRLHDDRRVFKQNKRLNFQQSHLRLLLFVYIVYVGGRTTMSRFADKQSSDRYELGVKYFVNNNKQPFILCFVDILIFFINNQLS